MGRIDITETCWLWTGARGGTLGHGQLRLAGRQRYAHIAMWELWVGPVPVGMQVLHRCDVPNCVRPDHLFLGTQKDNMADCKAKGRTRGGRPSVKITDEQLREMRDLYDSGVSPKDLSVRYGLDRQYTWKLCKRLSRPGV